MSLAQRITDLSTRIATEFKTVKSLLAGNNAGSLSGLLTTAKGSLLAAINELHGNQANFAPASHVGSGGSQHAAATTTTAGFMSAADKVKLDSLSNYTNFRGSYADLAALKTAIPTGGTGQWAILSISGGASKIALWDTDAGPADWVEAGAAATGGATNLSSSRDATTLTVTSDTGADAVLPAATTSLAGIMTAADKTKVDGAQLASEIGNPETDFVSTFNSGLL